MSEGNCEIASCGSTLGGRSFFDKYFKRRVCGNCYDENFRQAEDHGFGEWFEANYDKTAYPEEFWRKVGAFVDISKCDVGDGYGR